MTGFCLFILEVPEGASLINKQTTKILTVTFLAYLANNIAFFTDPSNSSRSTSYFNRDLNRGCLVYIVFLVFLRK